MLCYEIWVNGKRACVAGAENVRGLQVSLILNVSAALLFVRADTAESVPLKYQTSPGGVYVTFAVSNVDQSYEKALAMKLTIVQPPRNEFYGQRRFLTVDPNGFLIDICSPWEAE